MRRAQAEGLAALTAAPAQLLADPASDMAKGARTFDAAGDAPHGPIAALSPLAGAPTRSRLATPANVSRPVDRDVGALVKLIGVNLTSHGHWKRAT